MFVLLKSGGDCTQGQWIFAQTHRAECRTLPVPPTFSSASTGSATLLRNRLASLMSWSSAGIRDSARERARERELEREKKRMQCAHEGFIPHLFALIADVSQSSASDWSALDEPVLISRSYWRFDV